MIYIIIICHVIQKKTNKQTKKQKQNKTKKTNKQNTQKTKKKSKNKNKNKHKNKNKQKNKTKKPCIKFNPETLFIYITLVDRKLWSIKENGVVHHSLL